MDTMITALKGILGLLVIAIIVLLNNDRFTDWLVTWIVRRVRGPFGEWIVNRELAKLSSEYIIVKDLMLLRGDIEGRTTQIDHLVISPYGFFVIETKNFESSRLTAGDRFEQWILRRGRRRIMIHSPTRQNYAHIQALRTLLALADDIPVHSIVAFNGAVQFNHIDSRTPVIHYSELLDVIRSLSGSHLLPPSDVQDYLRRIEEARIVGRRARIRHIEDIRVESESRKSVRKEREKEVEGAEKTGEATSETVTEEKKCARCGAHMVLRNGAKGKFWGCSTYPKCRYTVNP